MSSWSFWGGWPGLGEEADIKCIRVIPFPGLVSSPAHIKAKVHVNSLSFVLVWEGVVWTTSGSQLPWSPATSGRGYQSVISSVMGTGEVSKPHT